jgi:calcineurin-like phosphoesterase family protein
MWLALLPTCKKYAEISWEGEKEMRSFITADLHLNHGNIIRYCQRPFRDVKEMNNCLVDNWNKTVSPGDTVYHVGDLGFRRIINGELHDRKYWESKLNGNIVFIAGNHDRYIGLKTLTINLNCEQVLIQHHPIYHKESIPGGIKFVLCGHVHGKWVRMRVGSTLVMNIGTDAWDFTPVELNDIFLQRESVKMLR